MITDLTDLAANGRFLVIDIEGDGHNPSTPVETAILEVERGIVVQTHYWLVNPGRPMTSFVKHLHGITDEMVADKPSFASIEPEVRELLTGSILINYGAASDIDMLRSVMPDIDFVPEAILDAQRLAKRILPDLERYRLSRVCEELGIAATYDGENSRGGLHSAIVDASMMAEAFLELSRRISGSAKHTRSIADSVQIKMSPQKEQRRREALEELGFVSPGMKP